MNNPDSILESVKKSLGLEANYHPFDDEIIMSINTVLGILNQLGVGQIGYQLDEEGEGTWTEFLAKEADAGIAIPEIKTYVAKRVQILFDPPTSGIYMDALKQVISELEFRINVAVETPLHED